MSASLAPSFTFIGDLSSSSPALLSCEEECEGEEESQTVVPANNDAPVLISKQNKPVFSSRYARAPITSGFDWLDEADTVP